MLSFRCLAYPSTYQLRYLTDIVSLMKLNPALASSLVIVLFSMAGIPPFPGFFAKAFVLFSLLQEQLIGLGVLSIILSCISCFYYIRLIQMMYFSHTKTILTFYPIEKTTSTILSITMLLLIFTFLKIDLISNFVHCMLFL